MGSSRLHGRIFALLDGLIMSIVGRSVSEEQFWVACLKFEYSMDAYYAAVASRTDSQTRLNQVTCKQLVASVQSVIDRFGQVWIFPTSSLCVLPEAHKGPHSTEFNLETGECGSEYSAAVREYLYATELCAKENVHCEENLTAKIALECGAFIGHSKTSCTLRSGHLGQHEYIE